MVSLNSNHVSYACTVLGRCDWKCACARISILQESARACTRERERDSKRGKCVCVSHVCVEKELDYGG